MVTACLLVTMLNTEASRWLWDLQTPLSRILFPFRLFGIQTVAIAGLGALALAEVSRRTPKRSWLLWSAVPALLLVDAGLIAVQALRQRDKDLPGLAEILAEDGDSSEYVLGPSAGQPGPIRGAVLSGAGEVRAYMLGYRSVHMIVEARSPVVVGLHQFNFTGWSCRIDGSEWSVPSRSAPPSALATCAVPAGRHAVEARLTASDLERAAWLAAFVGVALALASLMAGRVRRSFRATGSAVARP